MHEQSKESDVEDQFLRLCEEVLGTTVSLDDNFFDVGGDSLMAVRLATSVSEVFGVDVSLVSLYRTGALRDLLYDEVLATDSPLNALVAKPVPVTVLDRSNLVRLPQGDAWLVPASFNQEGQWLLESLNPDSRVNNVATTVLISGRLDEQRLVEAFMRVLERHQALRTNLVLADGGLVQVIKARPSGTTVVREEVSEQSIVEAVGNFVRWPYDLASDSLIRLGLFALPDQRTAVSIAAHHAVVDGWSLGTIKDEVSSFYSAPAASLPLPDLQYGDYSVWQQETFPHIWPSYSRYWSQVLDRANFDFSLAQNSSKARVSSFRGAHFARRIEAEDWKRLTHCAAVSRVSVPSLLLTLYTAALIRATGETSVALGAPMANRFTSRLDGMVGYVANLVVLDYQVDGATSLRDMLETVHERMIGAYTHSRLPLGKIIQELRHSRTRNSFPLVRVAFEYHQFGGDMLQFDGLVTQPFEWKGEWSIVDLSLHVTFVDGDAYLVYQYATDVVTEAHVQGLADTIATSLSGLPGSLSQTVIG